jgi:hypothetical protein
MGGLFLFLFNFDRFKVFALEDLAAIETFHVIDAVSSRNELGAGMVAGGLHKQRLDETYSIRAQVVVKPPWG